MINFEVNNEQIKNILTNSSVYLQMLKYMLSPYIKIQESLKKEFLLYKIKLTTIKF